MSKLTDEEIMKIEKGINAMKIKIDDGAYQPTRGHSTDAGLDLRTPVDLTIKPRGSVVVDTGVHVQLPVGTAGLLKSKSGLNVRNDILSEGVVDYGYTGSIVCKLYNNGDREQRLQKGDKITQLVIVPIVIPTIEVVDELDDSERGSHGFGSTGR